MQPVFSRAIRPASDSTSRCFMIAGSDIANGCASSLTERLASVAEPRQHCAPCGIGERGKGEVQHFFLILNHMV